MAEEAAYLQPPPGRRYVRSFLFSRRVNAPLVQVHLLVRILLVICLSAAQLRTMNTAHPDIVGAIVLWVPSISIFLLSGMHGKVARIYILLILPTVFSLFLSWTLLNPVPGSIVFVQRQVYPGFLTLSLAFWQVLWIGIVVGYYRWKRGIVNGILLASVAAIAISYLLPLPTWTIARVPFFHPLTLYISEQGLLLALTKVISYSGMMFSTIALVVTSRDIELMGAMRQLRIPRPIIFFLSTVFRALNLALTDYETIYQAQIARAVNAQPRSFLRRLRDLASIAVPMVAMMIRRSSEIGDALLARGYTLGQKDSDFYETSPWRPLDWSLLVACLVLLYLAVGPYPGLTALFQRWG
ncbi:energy-coupling factor transporter transmembrane component T [Dictyobacter kobayashii]|nr:energy-coupling factor transporter transmembrane component T [Dictyobacter kobayashii]